MQNNMKKIKRFIFLLAACLMLAGAWQIGYTAGKTPSNNPESDANKFYRSTGSIDFSGVEFTPLDIAAASEKINKREKKPYTIMIYMNGSDLESKMGAATDDIIEMQESGLSPNNANIVIFTGGTNRWNNSVIPANNCVIWEMLNGSLNEVAGLGLVNMGDPGTLSGFINFSAENFPADKFGLIMWDHGGGSIAGFGHDEKFNSSYLTLLDINYAFEKSAIVKNKLEFLGFDSCLMATVEMAVVASGYANYLIASEDIEPYDGWNYGFLSVLNGNSGISGAGLGKTIVDSFMDYYGNASGESLTMSVTDLSRAGRVMGALGGLMKQCSGSLLADRGISFKTLAARRGGTKTFGVGSPRDNECDMVDIGDMASKLSDLFPNESANLLAELNNCVVYNRHNSNANLKGLSVYYIYGGKEYGGSSLDMYASLNMNGDYTNYLNEFYGLLTGNDIAYRGRSSGGGNQGDGISPDEIVGMEFSLWKPVEGESGAYIMAGLQSGVGINPGETARAGMSSLWPKIGGKDVCLYKINGTGGSSLYAVPSAINGRDCDIVVLFSEEYPRGRILGARQEDGIIIQKGYDDILEGDKIAFYYPQRKNNEQKISWRKSDEFAAAEELKLEWLAPEDESWYCLRLTDIRQNEYFTDLKKLP